MTDQTNVKTAFACSLLSWPIFFPESAIEVSAQSLVVEISEEELASELRNGTGVDLPDQPVPQIEPQEFEAIYAWFIS